MGRTALVVEDDPDIRECVCFLLAEDYDVASCSSPTEARQALAARCPDVIVLDLLLYGESAEPLLAELLRWPLRPMIVVTSAATIAPQLAERYRVPLLC